MTDRIGYFTEFGQPVIASVHMLGRDMMTGWYACEHPEKPTDPMVLWHYDRGAKPCRGCQIAADALLRRNPDNSHVQWLVGRLGGQS